VAQRHDAFVKKLAQRRSDWQQQFASLHDTPWLTQHNPWGYLVDEWQLHEPLMVSASLQGSASARRFAELVQQMRAQNVRCAVAEPEAQRALLARLCQGECRIVDIDPLGRDLAGQGYVDFLQHIATRLQTCLAPEK
jgi:zinc transport system substrate-binding protein